MGVKVSQSLTENQYRARGEDSYSTVRDFLSDRKKYHRKYILGEVIQEKYEEGDSTVLGSLCHKLLSDPDNWDDSFQIALTDKPVGQMFDFCNKLYEKTVEATSLEGVVTKPIEELIAQAFTEVKFDREGNEVAFKKKEVSYVIERFFGTNAEDYYNQLRISSVKSIINPSDLANANNIVEGLQQHEHTRRIVNSKTEDEVEVFNELQIFFEIEGHPFKGMIDKLVIDHAAKIASPYDYKITWRTEDLLSTYRKNKYYLQVASYHLGLKSWLKENGMGDYNQEYIHYIVADSINYMRPLIYETGNVHIQEGLYGFVDLYGNYNPGLLKALDDIEWHKENDIWDISRENYENGGRVKLKQLSIES